METITLTDENHPRPKTRWYPATHRGIALFLPRIAKKALRWAELRTA